jgi:hypothetical protein
MRTTITLDDEIFRLYKIRAAELGTTFSQVVEEELKAAIEKERPAKRGFKLVTVHGGELRPDVDYSSNVALSDLMDEGVPVEKLR